VQSLKNTILDKGSLIQTNKCIYFRFSSREWSTNLPVKFIGTIRYVEESVTYSESVPAASQGTSDVTLHTQGLMG